MHTLLSVCPPRMESLFPPVLSKSYNQSPLCFKVWFSRNSSSHCWTPRLRSLMWGSELSLQWVDFCGISVLQSVIHPSTHYGIWFYCDCTPPTISLWLLLCLWIWGIFFGEFQCLPVDDCPAASCDSGVLARGCESTSFCSAILVPLPRTPFLKLCALVKCLTPLTLFPALQPRMYLLKFYFPLYNSFWVFLGWWYEVRTTTWPVHIGTRARWQIVVLQDKCYFWKFSDAVWN